MSKAAELAALIGSQTALSNRNLIINGAMQVAQRGTVTGAVHDSFGGPDRYKIGESSDTVFTMSQDSDTPTGEGFANSLKLDVTTADSSLASSDYASVIYNIEGQDLQSIKKGTSSAESVTLSFYIKSTITGTYVVQLYDNDNNRSVSKSYTVSSADTWEKKTLTFPADTTGAFDSDNALSLLIRWWFAAGTDYASGTLATSWESYNGANAAVGQVNAVNSASNNILITGIQLELGETATPFEHRSYGDELARCQRYYEKITVPQYTNFVAANNQFNSPMHAQFQYNVLKRTDPSVSVNKTEYSYYNVYNGSNGTGTLSASGTSNENMAALEWGGSIGAYSVHWVYLNTGSENYDGIISADAEL